MCTDSPPLPPPLSEPPASASGDTHVCLQLDLSPGAQVEVTIESRSTSGEVLEKRSFTFTNPVGAELPAPAVPVPPPAPQPVQPRALWRAVSSHGWADRLFILTVVLYLGIRMIGLPQFPIYFFTDEAAQTMLAADFLRDHLRGYDEVLLPTYFTNGDMYNLSLSVYVQVLPYLLFDRSVWATRGVCVLISVLAALAVGFSARNVFKSPYPWLAVLVLSLTPAWFLHSRTAFEAALAVSFYACFLYAYLMYRTASGRYLYAAIFFAALTFYSYSPAQMVVAMTAVLLFSVDFRYHYQHRAQIARGLGLMVLLALPYLRFQVIHPTARMDHLKMLGAYWLMDISPTEKLLAYLRTYTAGLNPFYWYLPDATELPRHIMKGYGYLLRQSLPFALVGLVLAARSIKDVRYRTLLLAVLAAPSGAALVGVGITRLLFMVVPMALLTAIGIEACLRWLRRWTISIWPAMVVFAVLAGGNVYMLGDALVNGPTWFTDYGLTGMQYGANQIFPAIAEYHQAHPGTRIILSPSWTNGTNVVARFFLGDDSNLEMGSIDGFISEYRLIGDDTLFIMLPEEYVKVPDNPKFTDVRLEQTLPYPDGRPGFYFVRLRYVDNIEQILAEEHMAARQPQYAAVQVGNETLEVRYSPLDMGAIESLFDGDIDTVTRTLEANPYTIELAFPQAHALSGVVLRIGGTATEATIKVYVAGRSEPFIYQKSLEAVPDPRDMVIDFDQRLEADRLVVEVLSSDDGPIAHVHLWEITFKE